MGRAGHNEQANLSLLLSAVRKVAQVQEWISIPQRRILEHLAEAPARTEGWVSFAQIRQFRDEAHILISQDMDALTTKGLVERRMDRTHSNRLHRFRITETGVDLLARIESREEDMPQLRELYQIADQCKRGTETNQSVFQIQLQARILTALQSGPITQAELAVLLQANRAQIRYAFEGLVKAGKVRVGDRPRGLWMLADTPQTREGAA